MIRTEELRLGNLVDAWSHKHNKRFIAEVIHLEDFTGSYKLGFWCEELGKWTGGCNPILLSEEWLERIGFESIEVVTESGDRTF